MNETTFSPKKQYRVLKAIKDEVDARRDNDRTIQLQFADVPDLELSLYCRILSELGMIRSFNIEDPVGTFTYPTGITPKGEDFLNEANKTFWDRAEDIAASVLKEKLKIDIKPFVDFFQAAFEKFQNERSS